MVLQNTPKEWLSLCRIILGHFSLVSLCFPCFLWRPCPIFLGRKQTYKEPFPLNHYHFCPTFPEPLYLIGNPMAILPSNNSTQKVTLHWNYPFPSLPPSGFELHWGSYHTFLTLGSVNQAHRWAHSGHSINVCCIKERMSEWINEEKPQMKLSWQKLH